MWRAASETDGVGRALAAVRAIIVPAGLCAVTTMQGFGSLAVSDIPAVRQFGVYAAIGTAIAFGLGLTAAPAVLSWLRPPPAERGGHGMTLRLLDATSGLATRRPVPVLVAFGLVTLLATAAIPFIRANTDLVGFLRADAPLRRDTEFVDAHFGGTLPLDFVLRRRDGRAVDSLDAYRRLDALEDAIRGRPYVTTVTSVLAIVRQVHRAQAGGALALPGDDRTLRDELDLLEESGHALVHRFAAPELRALRVAVRLRAVGTAESAPLVDVIVADGRRLLGDEYELEPTGALYLVVQDSTRLVVQQVSSFGTAIALVVVAIGLLFRSLTFTVLALIPNVMPILWTGGLMGVAGIDLSTGTAMIASAVLGLVVDDTIYYLSHYRHAYRGDAVAAIHETTRAVGAPVTAASVSLVLGFWVGVFGSFKPTIYFSLLTGLTMITGVACDLLVLPASLVVAERWQRGRAARRSS
jgi:predicted RND superfamily exporter protein